MKHVVVVGGGFAGIRLIRKLAKQKNVRTTLVNPNRQFRYTPALYRAANGFKMGTVRMSIEWMLLDVANTAIVYAHAVSVDPIKKLLLLDTKETINYDEVIFATGSVTTYFGIKGLDKYSYGIKSSAEVMALREHIHSNVLSANKASKDYVIIGAGPTGVELAAGLGSYIKHVARHHSAQVGHIRVYLIEAGTRVLPQMRDHAAKKALKRLQKLGVIVRTNTLVKSESAESLKTSLGSIRTDNVIWTAGTANNPIYSRMHGIFSLNDRGRVEVNSYLQAHKNIYVCGDNAATKYSGLALVAIWHANYIAKDIVRRLKNKHRKKYIEHRPVQIVPVGESFAVAQYGRITITGWAASLLRRCADFVGYSDVMGVAKAVSIWKGVETMDVVCTICKK